MNGCTHIVGVENLVSGLNPSIRMLGDASNPNRRKAKLWSLEVKEKIEGHNMRKSYYQAVANSSWANIGYLVVGKIEGKDTKEELRMLAKLHGIGVIVFNKENPEETYIEIQAQERDEIDLDVCNRIVEEKTRDLLNL